LRGVRRDHQEVRKGPGKPLLDGPIQQVGQFVPDLPSLQTAPFFIISKYLSEDP